MLRLYTPCRRRGFFYGCLLHTIRYIFLTFHLLTCYDSFYKRKVIRMRILLKKQARTYLESVDQYTRKRFSSALEKLIRLQGDIVQLKDQGNLYRFRNKRFRIHFTVEGSSIIVQSISPSQQPIDYSEVV